MDTETVTVNGDATYTTPTGYTLPTSGKVTGTYAWSAAYTPAAGDNNTPSSDPGTSAQEQFTILPAALGPFTTTASPTGVTLGTTSVTLKDSATLSGGFNPTGKGYQRLLLFRDKDPGIVPKPRLLAFIQEVIVGVLTRWENAGDVGLEAGAVVGCCEWATAGGPPSAHRGAVAIRRLDPEQVALEEILEPAAAVRPANDLAANGGFSS